MPPYPLFYEYGLDYFLCAENGMQVFLDNIGWGAIYSEYQVNIVLGISS